MGYNWDGYGMDHDVCFFGPGSVFLLSRTSHQFCYAGIFIVEILGYSHIPLGWNPLEMRPQEGVVY